MKLYSFIHDLRNNWKCVMVGFEDQNRGTFLPCLAVDMDVKSGFYHVTPIPLA
jgi:hypothetical protein